MICPKCKAEYREGFYVCSDCGVSLVAELPRENHDESSDNPIDYAEVASIPDFTRLTLVKSIFEAEGIRYFLWGEQMINAGVLRGGGPARLFVATDDAMNAKKVLDSLVFQED